MCGVEAPQSIQTQQDGDFDPSTHAMNALSNTLLALLYCYCVPIGTAGALSLGGYEIGGFTLMPDCNGFPLFAALAICVVWFFSITFGRLYLGAHSPTDVRGGLVLGVSVALFWWYLGDHYDALTLLLPQLWLIVFSAAFVIMLLSPQPRPMTPTFLQNCLLVGLQAGCTLGFRSEFERQHASGSAAARVSGSHDDMYSWRSHGLRIVIGYSLVLVARQANKTLLTAILRAAFGIDPSPTGKMKLKVDNPTKDKEGSSDDEGEDDVGVSTPLDKHVPRVLEGWDPWCCIGKVLVHDGGVAHYVWLPTCCSSHGVGNDLLEGVIEPWERCPFLCARKKRTDGARYAMWTKIFIDDTYAGKGFKTDADLYKI